MPYAEDGTLVNGMVRALVAQAPSGKMASELMLFGQFVGDWEITRRRYLLEDGSWKETRGELHCGWILGGRATQDVWIAYDSETGQLDQMGTTVRFLDADENVWKSVWISPMHNTVMEFRGRRAGSEIVLEYRDGGGEMIRWIFHDISMNAFRWRADTSIDGGKSWKTATEMSIRRIGRKGSPD